MSVVILPVTVIMALYSSKLMWLWTGNPVLVDRTHVVVTLLVIGTALNGLMNIPYALQLANGWTSLAFYLNLVAAIVMVPLIFLLSIHYGAPGAAAAWILLNAIYVVIGIQIMHRRLLKGEMWKWYGVDVGLPLLAALIVAYLGKPLINIAGSRPWVFCALATVFVGTLLASAAAAPEIRRALVQQIIAPKPAPSALAAAESSVTPPGFPSRP
jgi:O-antigen/teichoic acid export membrane protein